MPSPQGLICQVCNQRPATMHLCQIQAGAAEGAGSKTVHLHICGHCVRALDLDLSTRPPDVSTILAANFPGKKVPQLSINLLPEGQRASAAQIKTTCPGCGLTLAAFKRLNRFGCPGCLVAFGAVIEDSLQALHGATRHVGRLPRRCSSDAERLLRERQQLRRELDDALTEEAFERAARLRDQLQALDANEAV